MKFHPETNRRFVDKGNVKVYTTPLSDPESGYLSGFDKKVIKQGGIEVIRRSHNLSKRIFILLNGKIAFRSVDGHTLSLKSSTNPINSELMSAGGYFTNETTTEAEYLDIILKPGETSTIEPSRPVRKGRRLNVFQLLFSFKWISTLTAEQYLWISKGVFDPRHRFKYKKYGIHNSLYIFIISGEALINGWKLAYNDALQLNGQDHLLVELIKLSEFIIIEMSNL